MQNLREALAKLEKRQRIALEWFAENAGTDTGRVPLDRCSLRMPLDLRTASSRHRRKHYCLHPWDHVAAEVRSDYRTPHEASCPGSERSGRRTQSQCPGGAPSWPSIAVNRACVPQNPVPPERRRSKHEHHYQIEIALPPRVHRAPGTSPRTRLHRTATKICRNPQRETSKSHRAIKDRRRRRS